MADIIKQWQLNAPIKAVYNKWISADTVVQPAIRMKVTAEVGGEYIIDVNLDGVESKMIGTFLEVIPYQKLRYSWEWNRDGNVSQVTASFTQIHDGRTQIDIIHSGLADAQSKAMHDHGWDSYIDGFRKLVESDLSQK